MLGAVAQRVILRLILQSVLSDSPHPAPHTLQGPFPLPPRRTPHHFHPAIRPPAVHTWHTCLHLWSDRVACALEDRDASHILDFPAPPPPALAYRTHSVYICTHHLVQTEELALNPHPEPGTEGTAPCAAQCAGGGVALFTLPWDGLFICSLDQELPRAGTMSCSFTNVALVCNTVPGTL